MYKPRHDDHFDSDPLVVEANRMIKMERLLSTLSNGSASPLRDSIVDKITHLLNQSSPSYQFLVSENKRLQSELDGITNQLTSLQEEILIERQSWESEAACFVPSRSPHRRMGNDLKALIIGVITLIYLLIRNFYGTS